MTSPDFSPGRLLLSETLLLSISYDHLPSMTTLHTALDAPSLVFVPPVGTCFLNHTNLPGADLDIRRMPAGGTPWTGRINYGYAFGRRHPLAGQILRDHRITW